jgi:hypothetical protein
MDITVQLDGTGNASISPNDIDNGTSDNCGIASMTVSPNTFTSSNVGDNAVTLTVTDLNGNISTCSAIVTVENNTLSTTEEVFKLLKISPNPFDDQIEIVVPNEFSNNEFTIQIHDLNGRLVYSKNDSAFNGKIQLVGLSKLEEAPYLLRIINKNTGASILKRLIKH